MKEQLEILEKSLGDGIKQPSANEVASIIRFRKTMYTKRDMKVGETIGYNDIIYTAPAYGIYAKFEDIVVGKKLNQDVSANTPITWDLSVLKMRNSFVESGSKYRESSFI